MKIKRELREQARDLRRQGWSVRSITEHLQVSKASISSWVRDIGLTEEQIEALKTNQRQWAGRNKGAQSNRERARQQRLADQEKGRLKARENRPLHQMGCMLYWAEGSKDKGRLYFVNSDKNMLLLFMRFLREELNVVDELISLTIHCHTEDADEKSRMAVYWSSLFGLPVASVKQIYTKPGSETRINKLANGVCGILVCRTELTMHVFGAIQEYGGFDNPDWLF